MTKQIASCAGKPVVIHVLNAVNQCVKDVRMSFTWKVTFAIHVKPHVPHAGMELNALNVLLTSTSQSQCCVLSVMGMKIRVMSVMIQNALHVLMGIFCLKIFA